MHQRALVSSLLVATLASGCATSPAMQAYQAPHRAHPDVEQRARKIRTIAVLPPDIRISSLSAGGVEELRDDWSTTGWSLKCVCSALTTLIRRSGTRWPRSGPCSGR